ncbi:hypothetical protein GQG94_004604 [Salmonella enterica]|nr:hypothetical protein [Salmonella enterica subsp. enterica serovar Mbandaka]EEJ1220307.1 hypothetical protein [Salmonella enterica]ELK3355859.1 hypothetical protein [Salmonella enterica]
MKFTKKQYILISILFIFVAFFGFMLSISSNGNDVLGVQALCNALWKIFAVVGGTMLLIGIFTKADGKN